MELKLKQKNGTISLVIKQDDFKFKQVVTRVDDNKTVDSNFIQSLHDVADDLEEHNERIMASIMDGKPHYDSLVTDEFNTIFNEKLSEIEVESFHRKTNGTKKIYKDIFKSFNKLGLLDFSALPLNKAKKAFQKAMKSYNEDNKNSVSEQTNPFLSDEQIESIEQIELMDIHTDICKSFNKMVEGIEGVDKLDEKLGTYENFIDDAKNIMWGMTNEQLDKIDSKEFERIYCEIGRLEFISQFAENKKEVNKSNYDWSDRVNLWRKEYADKKEQLDDLIDAKSISFNEEKSRRHEIRKLKCLLDFRTEIDDLKDNEVLSQSVGIYQCRECGGTHFEVLKKVQRCHKCGHCIDRFYLD